MNSFFNSRPVDRLLAVAILLALLVAGFSLIQFVYVEQLVTLNDKLNLKKRKNARVDAILNSEGDLQEKIGHLKRGSRQNEIFLNGRESAAAVSELENLVKKLILARSGTLIQLIKPYPILVGDDYSEVSLEVGIRKIGHQGLQRLLYEIENNVPVLQIQELDIRQTPQRYTLGMDQSKPEEDLQVTFLVSGFFRASGPAE